MTTSFESADYSPVGDALDSRKMISVSIHGLQYSIRRQDTVLCLCKVLKSMLMLGPFYDERNVKVVESLLLPCVTVQEII